ncbi:MAG: glutamate-1-semialdehyde-2,1-aminomutase [Planctomycetaceae bacterium]|nr:glutamate-1-semialdehyde-2,1-aminomutase [Planctomycetaceae bacterium]
MTESTREPSTTSTTSRPRSEASHRRALGSLVGGVNSPVRAFGAVGGIPVAVDRAEGPRIRDVDGNWYVDYVGSWGPAILGHAHPDVVAAVRAAAGDGFTFGAPCDHETDLAELILSALPGNDRIRFVSSGTESCMSVIRLARAATGRERVIKFAGNYHGHSDAMLVEAGSGAVTHGVPNSPGVVPDVARATMTCPFNDADSVRRTMERNGDSVAAVLVEPVAGNMGLVPPEPGFLESLREICDEHGSLLVFDEVMTGFRVGWGGHQRTCGVLPDLTCLGKVVGGGLPAAAYVGPASLMDQVSPAGPVYQAGTLSGNPIAMVAGLETLRHCEREGFYERLGGLTRRLAVGLRKSAMDRGVPLQTTSVGGMMGIAFSERPIRDFDDARNADHERYAEFFHAMLDRGFWLPPSGYEAWFVSSAHGEDHIDRTIEAAASAMEDLS